MAGGPAWVVGEAALKVLPTTAPTAKKALAATFLVYEALYVAHQQIFGEEHKEHPPEPIGECPNPKLNTGQPTGQMPNGDPSNSNTQPRPFNERPDIDWSDYE
jgi:hypothetical protein